MKLTSLILTFIILMLNIVPCCAWENNEENNRKINHSEKSAPTNGKDECENCSPFYSCGNCIASLETPLTFAIAPQNKDLSVTFYRKLLLTFTEGVTKGIWQPPKKG
ncbi:DUF6660 family protein [Pedobacter cryotolerans]|uniref:Uncharacterized protein n=1 Tax=Pedobacter cryotolerans TaxID=2571270 RepID=A0A4U1C2I0_9SPHI|nr:DUF6660 family protein [Pedobacter cryotolerans]TKB97357.1 hypothetical protein FA045_16525 [Pedobacter cryotolerans]